MTHHLKLHPEPFQAATDSLKPWEFRKDDRGFEVGHKVELREWDPTLTAHEINTENEYGVECLPVGYTGRTITGTITYIIREGYGIPEGFCIFTYQAH